MSENVKTILAKYLARGGYDGLKNRNKGCACQIDGIIDCGECDGSCEPGRVIALSVNPYTDVPDEVNGAEELAMYTDDDVMPGRGVRSEV